MAILLVFNTMTGQKPISHKKRDRNKKKILQEPQSACLCIHIWAVQFNSTK